MAKTQPELVIDYIIEHGSITSAEANSELGVSRLAEIIRVLKSMGYSIDSVWEVGKNRYGQDVRYKRYFLDLKDGYPEGAFEMFD